MQMNKSEKLLSWIAFISLSCQVYSYAQSTWSVGSNVQINITGSPHLVLDQFNLENDGNLFAGTSTIHFTGTGDNHLRTGNANFYKVVLGKSGGGTIQLLDDLSVQKELAFTANNNYLQLNEFDLIVTGNASLSGFDSDQYVVTNGVGKLVKQAMTAFTYPVGFDQLTYNPLELEERLTPDDIGVRCLRDALDNGTTGTPITSDVVNVSWEVSEKTAGGCRLKMTATWFESDENSPSFDANNCGIGYWSDIFQQWFVAHDSIGNKEGNGHFSRTQYNINKLGLFSIMDRQYELEGLAAVRPKVILQGPYNPVDRLMNDDLRSHLPVPLIPLIQPQKENIAIESPSNIFADYGPDSIVDWVEVELKREDYSFADLQAALLQRDGDVVGIDGSTPVQFIYVDPDESYHVIIRHRNHLSIMTAGTFDLFSN